MSAPALHIHAPSLHLRREDGSGFDYEEDLVIDDPDLLEDRDFLREMQDSLERGYRKSTEQEELLRQARIEMGIENACAGCGCSESRCCEGGCVWATENLCSRCYRRVS
jgi:hypothetical protein